MGNFIKEFCTMLELMRMQNTTYAQLKSLTVTVFLSVGIFYLCFFVIKAVAVCLMAKKRGITYWWMGMIPFANYVVIGKLAGPVRIFRIDVKNMGLVVAICFGVTYIGSAIYSVFTFGDYFAKLWAENLKWDEMYEFSSVIGESLYIALGYVGYVVDLISVFAYLSLVYAFFSKYSPQHRILFGLLSLIQPLFGIFILAVRNNKAYASVEEFYKEKYAKQFGQTYDPFSNPYNTRENPYETKNTGDPFSDDDNTNNSDNGDNSSPFDEF